MKKKHLLIIIFLHSFFGFSIFNPNSLTITPPPETPCTYVYPDADGDGYYSTIKVCLESLDSSIAYQDANHPGNDCNDLDDLYHPGSIYYLDSDGDGFGDSLLTITTACESVIGFEITNGDCNDENALINPDSYWYNDNDGDGYGNIGMPYPLNPICQQPIGYVLDNTDCNDNQVLFHKIENWYIDTDGDGYGDGTPISSCGAPISGYVNNNFDSCPTASGPFEGCQIPNPTLVYAGGTKNYIITTTPRVPVSSTQNIMNSYDATVNITYYDGLGRPNQQIAIAQSSTGKNIVTPMEYDDFGRQVKEYLPYATSGLGLDYVNTALTDQPNFPQYSGQVSYSQKGFDNSPLNRLLAQAAPGNDWAMSNNHTIKFHYQTNVSNGIQAVKFYKVTATSTNLLNNGYYAISLQDNGFYPLSQLYLTITKNENWLSGDDNTIQEFKDKEGRVVLKRTFGESNVNGSVINDKHDTYYVYDQYGNLTYVIPPKVDTSIVLSQTVLDNFCYQYRYDYRNRLVEKKLPGKQWEFIVYDRLDRVVATGPSFAPFSNLLVTPAKIGWMITKYDAFNRVVYTGWQQASTVTSANRKSLQTTQNGLTTTLNESKTTSGTIDGVTVYYTNSVAPTSFKLMTVNYYDDYNYPNAPTVPDNVMSDNSQPVYYNNSIKPKGLPTGSWVRVPELSTTTPVKAETSYTLYDNKARVVRTRTINYLTGYTQVDNRIDFAGKVLFTETKHKRLNADANEIYTKEVFTYSNQDRLLTQTHQIGTTGTPQLIADNTYNELGELITKKVGNTSATPLQKVDYSYNIRGWMTEINDVTDLKTSTENDLFAFKLNYNTVLDTSPDYTGKPLFNGNISETYWRTKSDNVKRKYSYEYDGLNRLINAVYQKPDNAISVTNSYNETLEYDKNGNITALQRTGAFDDAIMNFQIDNLNYFYGSGNASNLLMKVTDSSNDPSGFKDDSNGGNDTSDDYGYDTNGNLIKDENKGIVTTTGNAIFYNHLNLPIKIIFGTTGTIEYLYNANGKKVKKIVTQSSGITTTDYFDGFQYSNNVLLFFPTSEGYVSNTVISGVNNYNYVYNYTDHLGNSRLSYSKDTATGVVKILEENHYYPFGMKHSNYNVNMSYYYHYDPVLNLTIYNHPLVDGAPAPVITSGVASPFKYKFQGQERQDELGLNWDSFKWRNYDYAIGRFMCIDPLAEKYVYNSPYAFAENRVIDGRELEGLEWVDAKDHSVVIYNPQANNGKGDYTQNATDEDRAWGASLNATPTGSAQFQKLVKMEHPVAITAAYGERPVDTDGLPILGGTVTPTTNNPDGATYITIYPANIKDDVAQTQANDKKGLNTKNESGVLLNNVSETEMTGAVLGQEIEHATPENIKMQHDKAPRKEIEKKPDAVSNQILRESGN